MIHVQRRQETDTGALDIESAVGIKEPLPCLPGYDGSESEIAVLFGLCDSQRRKIFVECFFCHGMPKLYASVKMNVKENDFLQWIVLS